MLLTDAAGGSVSPLWSQRPVDAANITQSCCRLTPVGEGQLKFLINLV